MSRISAQGIIARAIHAISVNDASFENTGKLLSLSTIKGNINLIGYVDKIRIVMFSVIRIDYKNNFQK